MVLASLIMGASTSGAGAKRSDENFSPAFNEARVATVVKLQELQEKGLLTSDQLDWYSVALGNPRIAPEVLVPKESLIITAEQREQIEAFHREGAEPLISEIFDMLRSDRYKGVFIRGGMYGGKSYVLCRFLEEAQNQGVANLLTFTGIPEGGIKSRIHGAQRECNTLPSGEELRSYLENELIEMVYEGNGKPVLIAVDEASWCLPQIKMLLSFISERGLNNNVKLVLAGLNKDVRGADTPLADYVESDRELGVISVPTYRVPPTNSDAIQLLPPEGFTTRFFELPGHSDWMLLDPGLPPVYIPRGTVDSDGVPVVQYAPLPGEMLQVVQSFASLPQDPRRQKAFLNYLIFRKVA